MRITKVAIFSAILLFRVTGCADVQEFDRKPKQIIIESNGFRSVFYLSEVSTVTKYGFVPAATRFKRYEEIWFHDSITTTTSGTIICGYEYPDVHGAQWFKDGKMLAEEYQPILGPGIFGYSIPKKYSIAFPVGWYFQRISGIHKWPNVKNNKMQLTPGKYIAVAGSDRVFAASSQSELSACKFREEDASIAFEVVDE